MPTSTSYLFPHQSLMASQIALDAILGIEATDVQALAVELSNLIALAALSEDDRAKLGGIAEGAIGPWGQTDLNAGERRILSIGDLHHVLFYSHPGDLQIEVAEDLGAGFECALLIGAGAGRPTFVASGGQTLQFDATSNQASPGPSWAYVRRIAPNTYVVLGLTPDAPVIGSVSWSEVTDKPTSFNPSVHAHGLSDVTGLETALDSRLAGAPYVAGRYYHELVPHSGMTLSNAQVAFVPIMIRRRQAFDRIALEIIAAQGGSSIRLGLYDENDGMPGARLEHSAELASTSNGLLTHVIARTLDPGRYWLALQVSNSSLGLRNGYCYGHGLVSSGSANGLTQPAIAATLLNTYGVGLPAAGANASWAAGLLVPAIMLRAA